MRKLKGKGKGPAPEPEEDEDEDDEDVDETNLAEVSSLERCGSFTKLHGNVEVSTVAKRLAGQLHAQLKTGTMTSHCCSDPKPQGAKLLLALACSKYMAVVIRLAHVCKAECPSPLTGRRRRRRRQ